MHEFLANYGQLLLDGTIATLIMVFVSTFCAYLLGIPVGVLLVITSSGSLRPNRTLNAILGWIVNVGRSMPFVILMVAVIPFSRFVMGTSLGTKGIIVPLTIAAFPFIARMIENSLKEVSSGVLEAAQSCGASTFQVIWKVLLREGLPSIARNVPVVIITLIGYSAIGGALGAGGLGDIAVRYGYMRYETNVMIATIVILIVLIQIIQSVGDFLARKIDKRA